MSISSCRKSKAMPFYVKHSMSAESTKNYINSYVMLMPQNVSALVQYVNSLIYFLAKEFLLVFVLPSASCMKRLKKGLTLIKGACQPLPATKWEACWRFFSNYCCTLPPSYRPARLVGEKTPTDLSHPFGTVSIQNRTKGGALEKKSRCSGPVSSWFFAIFALKTKLFLSSYKIQKEWPYNLRPLPDF